MSACARAAWAGRPGLVESPWWVSMPSLASRLAEACAHAGGLQGLARVAGGDQQEDAGGIAPSDEPFGLLAGVAASPDPLLALKALVAALGMGLVPSDVGPAQELGVHGPSFAGDAASLRELFCAACDAAETGALIGPPTGGVRTAFLRAFERAVELGASVLRVTGVLAWCFPRSFYSLDGATRAFLLAPGPAGLGIAQADLPQAPADYLALLQFLAGEMDAARLPYHDFLEMEKAIAAGHRLADGLAADDRERLLREELAPALQRLRPCDDSWLAAQLGALAQGRGLSPA